MTQSFVWPAMAALLFLSPAGVSAQSAAAPAANPLLADSRLPLNYPAFDQLQDSHFAPALDLGMTQQLEEVAAITANPTPPSFENTLLALERSGRQLNRATTMLFGQLGVDANPARRMLQADYAPRLAAHRDAINLDSRLYARIRSLHERRAVLGLDATAVRLIERTHQRFERAGAQLSEADKARLKALNGELAVLGARFERQVQEEVNASAVIVERAEDLAGFTPAQVAAAAAAARAQKLDGKWLIALINSTDQPALAQLENRALRERLYRASIGRGSRGNEADNRAVFTRTMALRAERAQLLGFANHAAWVLDAETAKTPAAANGLLRRLSPMALAAAQREAAALQALIDREQNSAGQASFKLAPWDWAYYTEMLRQQKYGFDASALKPYFELDSVLEKGVFYAAGQLYGLRFKRRTDLPVYHPDVRVYDVLEADGSQLAILLLDPYARPSKRGGAWATNYVLPDRALGTRAVVHNHMNILRPADGQPTLLSYGEVNVLFHEFGHNLHSMFADVPYPSFVGGVERDFIEFPSQVNEMWADWPAVLQNYARHHQTGEAMPRALFDKFLATRTFNQGFERLSYLSAALLDLQWHQLGAVQVPAPEQAMDFEARVLREQGVAFEPILPRYRTPYFSHSMNVYAAAYYGYVWAQVLDADTVEWFRANGGLTRANGDVFRAKLLSRGSSRDSMGMVRDVIGREPRIEPLLERMGFIEKAAAR